MYQTGTHGSVGGRLANQSSASYPIEQTSAEARMRRFADRERADPMKKASRRMHVSELL